MTKRLKKALIDYYYFSGHTKVMSDKEIIKTIQEELKDEWGEGGDKGYAIFEESNDFPVPILVIERIDEVGAYDGDIDAANQAKKDGIKLIPCYDYPFRTYPFNCYRFIDTPENRQALLENIRALRD